MARIVNVAPSPSSPIVLPPRLVRLRDGRDYRLRPLTARDAARVAEMFATLSSETVRARYGYLIHDMTPARATRLVDVDVAREAPLGIFEWDASGREGRLWAMGRLVHAPDNQSAECAFLVHDRQRRLGMASTLLKYLRVLGRRRGLPRLFAQVRRENKAMLNVFIQNGARLHFSADSDVVEIDIPLRLPKILFDKGAPAPSIAGMSSPEKKGFSPVALVVDLVLVAAFFTFFYYLLQSHVPSNDPTMIRFWSTMAAACMSGVFWIALQMLKTVFRFQRANRK
ncbi:GNAT family N-acetyltransferase [Oleiharenicola sp. Vm1]|uniref:GNAT family N-acetyltransferase n=1 Tax=Oleiharenicola sp. Vm1 TaxID=3398393 RepID=UPI0039F5AA8F